MHHLVAMSYRIQPGKMQEFLTEVQHWEQMAMSSPHAPEDHDVYLHRTDPSRALVLARFSSDEQAAAFSATGAFEQFRDGVRSAVDEMSEIDSYDLYYATGSSGPHVFFGEDA